MLVQNPPRAQLRCVETPCIFTYFNYFLLTKAARARPEQCLQRVLLSGLYPTCSAIDVQSCV